MPVKYEQAADGLLRTAPAVLALCRNRDAGLILFAPAGWTQRKEAIANG